MSPAYNTIKAFPALNTQNDINHNRTSQQMALSTAVLFPATHHYNRTLFTPSGDN
ncbi:hypothetical protein HanXRQr2_Chr13g0616191 [Helianthus annuus]|uniref:Uncharacterized protein n=1 Tax=Helianthus annuus TaxID=4232 RepID=A0A9K3EMN8_HELAN|nr:hypothetical protein HanXRQr2_Chr13g0616191 [Helianthus annuus]